MQEVHDAALATGQKLIDRIASDADHIGKQQAKIASLMSVNEILIEKMRLLSSFPQLEYCNKRADNLPADSAAVAVVGIAEPLSTSSLPSSLPVYSHTLQAAISVSGFDWIAYATKSNIAARSLSAAPLAAFTADCCFDQVAVSSTSSLPSGFGLGHSQHDVDGIDGYDDLDRISSDPPTSHALPSSPAPPCKSRRAGKKNRKRQKAESPQSDCTEIECV